MKNYLALVLVALTLSSCNSAQPNVSPTPTPTPIPSPVIPTVLSMMGTWQGDLTLYRGTLASGKMKLVLKQVVDDQINVSFQVANSNGDMFKEFVNTPGYIVLTEKRMQVKVQNSSANLSFDGLYKDNNWVGTATLVGTGGTLEGIYDLTLQK